MPLFGIDGGSDRKALYLIMPEIEPEQPGVKSGRTRRRVLTLLGALILILGVTGGILWKWFPRTAEKLVPIERRTERTEQKAPTKPEPTATETPREKIDRGKVRAQLESDIKQQAEKKIAEAGEDRRQLNEIEAWRDQQLVDLNRIVARIDETFGSDGTTAGYRKGVKLLESQGANAALAHLQARHAQRAALMESLSGSATSKELKLRNLLQEALLEAYLLKITFQFDEAEAKYRAVVERTEKWPRARNELARFLIQRGVVIEPEKGNEMLLEAANLCLGTVASTSREDSARDWAMAQNNYGDALSNLGVRSGGSEVREGREQLEVAATAYRSALEVMKREHSPLDWATTQQNLGTVLSDLGIRSKGSEGREQLEEAVAAYRSALEVRTKNETPKDWAMTQNDLGNVLSNLGIRIEEDEGREQLKEAVEAYRSALEVRTRENSPEAWATTQNNLGTVLTDLGIRSGEKAGLEDLEAAVASYRSALEVRTREALPGEWATTLNNLVDALTELAGVSEGEKREELLEEAAKGYETLIAASEEEVIDKSAAAGFLGDFSFFKLRRNDAAGALKAANKALEADPDQIWIKTNLVTAYLLLDEWDKAREVLTENALQVPYGEDPFWQVMLNDFDELKKFGVSHPNIKRMREYIVAHYNPKNGDLAPAEESE